MPPPLHLDPATLPAMPLLVDKDGIRQGNSQRYEMEQLDGIVLLDPTLQLIVGYKDVRPDEFWVRGHMPGYPLMPGVLMCEAAAQLSSYYSYATKQIAGDFVGFAGMEEVRFRQPVKVGQRLYLVGKALKVTRRSVIFNVQAFVETTFVFNANITGIALFRTESSPTPLVSAEA
ncbi:MAG: beta-hydroxyacyl-ACP dehydratase [Planctomycetota bacterium]|nr:beta-hydroxyacyl-ACP dehydratase [Planctomycetota bacterium]